MSSTVYSGPKQPRNPRRGFADKVELADRRRPDKKATRSSQVEVKIRNFAKMALGPEVIKYPYKHKKHRK
jgi:hypothetical protein